MIFTQLAHFMPPECWWQDCLVTKPNLQSLCAQAFNIPFCVPQYSSLCEGVHESLHARGTLLWAHAVLVSSPRYRTCQAQRVHQDCSTRWRPFHGVNLTFIRFRPDPLLLFCAPGIKKLIKVSCRQYVGLYVRLLYLCQEPKLVLSVPPSSLQK